MFRSLTLIAFSIATWNLSAQVPGWSVEQVRHTLSQDNDTLYVVNFWATWCEPCVAELPAFNKLKDKTEGTKIHILLVSLDDPRKVKNHLDPFVKRHNIRVTVVNLNETDPNRYIPQIETRWQGSIPATIFAKNGNRIFVEEPLKYSELKKIVKKFNP